MPWQALVNTRALTLLCSTPSTPLYTLQYSLSLEALSQELSIFLD